MPAALILALLLLAAPAAATPLDRPEEIAGEDWSGPAWTAAAIEALVPLVRSTREIEVDWGEGDTGRAESDLRVSLLVLDLGPATDVSPRQALHLAMHNEIGEFGTAWSLTPIAHVWTFRAARRLEAGIYEIDAVVLDYEAPGCVFREAGIRVDARALSAEVRRARGLSFGDARRIRHPVAVSLAPRGCAR